MTSLDDIARSCFSTIDNHEHNFHNHMTTTINNRPSWADDETLRVVRPEVRKILEASPAFAKLSEVEKKDLASKMVKVAAYMSNPDGLAAQELSPNGGVLARAQADPPPNAVHATKQRLSQDPGFAGEDFQAGAGRQYTEQFGELVKKVDFPKFVSGLIKGVFQAIVESSIEQMRAYGELVANVAKTVDQFAQDNISENNARDWLKQRFPDKLKIETHDRSSSFAEGETPPPQPKLVAVGDDPAAVAKTISEELQMAKPVSDISNEEDERMIVQAARLQMARSRQQLLSSMVMLGINRIVITDGLIHAKVIFDMKASDTAKRVARASMYDRQQEHFGMKTSVEYGGWFSPVDASMSSEYSTDHVATVQSSVDDTSESKGELKAKLSGEVRVNFKSDYLPMEKLATPGMIASIQGNAKPFDPNEKPAATAPPR